MNPQPGFKFPDLTALGMSVLRDVQAGRLIGSTTLPYSKAIESHGGMEEVIRDCLSMVRPEIMDLQGKLVTRSKLDSIRLGQDEDDAWSEPMGYLDYITDSRSPSYFRCYVGQCRVARRRISSQHAQSILRASYDSLHYYML